jgi:hypothetical protein
VLVPVSHAELHYLPLAAPVPGDGSIRLLIEGYELAVTPSACVWGRTGRPTGEQRRRRAGTGAAGFDIVEVLRGWPSGLAHSTSSGNRLSASAIGLRLAG